MAAIFSFDETDEHIPRTRRDTISSLSSFDDRWQSDVQSPEEENTRFRHFGKPWDDIVEEDELPSRVGTPPIPIPNGRGQTPEVQCGRSVQVDFDEEFVSKHIQLEGRLSRKMVPSDFDQVRVLGKGGYGTVLLVKHKASGRLFAQKQLKKASLVVQTKIIGAMLRKLD